MKKTLIALMLFVAAPQAVRAMDSVGNGQSAEIQNLHATIDQLKKRVFQHKYNSTDPTVDTEKKQLIEEVQNVNMPEHLKQAYMSHVKNKAMFDQIVLGVVPSCQKTGGYNEDVLAQLQRNAAQLKITADDFVQRYVQLSNEINELKCVFLDIRTESQGDNILDTLTTKMQSLSLHKKSDERDEPSVSISVHANSHSSTVTIEGTGSVKINVVHQHSHTS